MNNIYKTIYIISPKADIKIEDFIQKYNHFINSHGGDIKKTDIWGKKLLAYDLKGFREGIYVAITFTAPPQCLHQTDKKMAEDVNILKHNTISLTD